VLCLIVVALLPSKNPFAVNKIIITMIIIKEPAEDRRVNFGDLGEDGMIILK
jgi:hypothetical protein